MPITYTNTDQTRTTASTPVYALGAGDTLIVGPDAQLVTTGSLSPVITGPNGVELRLQGDLIAAISHGVELNAGADIRIAATGSISAGRDGIHVNGGVQSISNAGVIEAELTAIAMGDGGELLNNGLISGARGVNADGFLRLFNTGTIQTFDNPDDLFWTSAAVIATGGANIVNSGTIQAAAGSAIVAGGLTGGLDLLNTGTIAALAGDAISGGGADDSVVNQGTISGIVFLYGGDDLYDGTLGHLQGNVFGGQGDDTVLGGAANESLNGGTGADQIAGGEGDDTIAGGAGFDMLEGGAGFDVLSYRDDLAGVSVSLAAGEASGGEADGDVFSGFEGVIGGGGGDTLTGSNGSDRFWGEGGHDLLNGGTGLDRLVGGAGNDTLIGGAGLDVLHGGQGDDVFRFNSLADSGVTAGTRDRIVDFSTADLDVIHLSAIDADAVTAGNQAFSFIGAAAFGNVAGQLRYAAGPAATIVLADTNGDGAADFTLWLSGNLMLNAADFAL